MCPQIHKVPVEHKTQKSTETSSVFLFYWCRSEAIWAGFWHHSPRFWTGLRCPLGTHRAGGSGSITRPSVPPDQNLIPWLPSPCELEDTLFLWDGSVTDALPDLLMRVRIHLGINGFRPRKEPQNSIYLRKSRHFKQTVIFVAKPGDERAASCPGEAAEGEYYQTPCSSDLLLPHHLLLHTHLQKVPILPCGQMLQVPYWGRT